ncbi:hypothetical protein D3C85_1472370 [compost metagenome]
MTSIHFIISKLRFHSDDFLSNCINYYPVESKDCGSYLFIRPRIRMVQQKFRKISKIRVQSHNEHALLLSTVLN